MNITFDKESELEYEFAHGHKPKGEGSWAFEARYSDGFGAYTFETCTMPGFKYAAAKKAAKAHFKAVAPGAAMTCEFYVLP